jgi:hypothetical protein
MKDIKPKLDAWRNLQTQLAAAAGRNPHQTTASLPQRHKVATSENASRPAEAGQESSFDWVKLELNAEASNLHVTAAHGRRTPKRSIPHAAYRHDWPGHRSDRPVHAPEGEF